MERLYIGLIIAIVILVIVICAQIYFARSARTQTFAQFATGFWRASREDCDAGGYSDAYLFIAQPVGSRANGYIVAISGDSSESGDNINSAIELKFSPRGTHDARASLVIDGETSEITIKCDHVRCEMQWTDADGDALFTWTKNGEITRALAHNVARADDSDKLAI